MLNYKRLCKNTEKEKIQRDRRQLFRKVLHATDNDDMAWRILESRPYRKYIQNLGIVASSTPFEEDVDLKDSPHVRIK